MKRIYIAGSLSPKGARPDCSNGAIEYLFNVRDMIHAAVLLIRKGWAPFCPALDILYFLYLPPGEQIEERTIMDVSLAWLQASDAILMLPRWMLSAGSCAEHEEAQARGISIYYHIDEVPGHSDA